MTAVEQGICGPYALSVVLGKSMDEIIKDWIGGYKGYAPLNQIISMLDFYKVKYQRANGRRAKTFHELPKGIDKVIARIQWEGNWKHWTEAQKNTHYVALKKTNGTWGVYTDEYKPKGFRLEWSYYLKDGYITSYLYIL